MKTVLAVVAFLAVGVILAAGQSCPTKTSCATCKAENACVWCEAQRGTDFVGVGHCALGTDKSVCNADALKAINVLPHLLGSTSLVDWYTVTTASAALAPPAKRDCPKKKAADFVATLLVNAKTCPDCVAATEEWCHLASDEGTASTGLCLNKVAGVATKCLTDIKQVMKANGTMANAAAQCPKKPTKTACNALKNCSACRTKGCVWCGQGIFEKTSQRNVEGTGFGKCIDMPADVTVDSATFCGTPAVGTTDLFKYKLSDTKDYEAKMTPFSTLNGWADNNECTANEVDVDATGTDCDKCLKVKDAKFCSAETTITGKTPSVKEGSICVKQADVSKATSLCKTLEVTAAADAFYATVSKLTSDKDKCPTGTTPTTAGPTTTVSTSGAAQVFVSGSASLILAFVVAALF